MDNLVGRSPELERIDAVLDARDALPAGVLLQGAAGIGKTAIWREAIRRAHDRGYLVLECALSRNESRLAFAGLADLIRPVHGDILPELARPQALALETALAIVGGSSSPPDERAVAFGFHGALMVLAGRSPIALAVDDIQWLDPSSALVLSYALRRLRRESVLAVFAERDDEGPDGHVSPVAEIGLELARIAVGPLPLGAIHRMIRTRLGTSLPRPHLLRIHAASSGNPMHALELARAIDVDGAKSPTALLALLERRVASLPEAAQHALALAGIASESDLGVLARAYGSHLREDLRPAIDADLVGIVADRIRFTHPLIATAAEASVSQARRRELHLLLAQATSSQEARVTHLAQATPEPRADVADTVEQAAMSTRRRGARAASAELFDAAARLTPHAESWDEARRRLAAAAAWYDAGDGRRAKDILVALLRHLEKGDQRCEARWRLGVILDEAGRWQEASALWLEALAEAESPGLKSQLLSSLAISAFYTRSVPDATRQAAEAVGFAERSADPAHLARALAVQALTLAMSGGNGYGAALERALALEAGIDDWLGDWSPSAVAAECARHSGDVAGSRRHYSTVLSRATNAGDANVEQWAAFGLASAEILAGDLRHASELADVVLDIADQTGQMRIPARSLRAHVDAYLGELAAARALVAEAIADATSAGEATHLFGAHVVMAVIESCAGDSAASARAYAAARRIASEVGLAHATALRAFINEAEVAAAVGELGQARDAIAAFETSVGGSPPAWAASILHRARGSVLAAQGDLRAAHDELERAAEDPDAPPLDRGRTALALGSLRRRLREYARARTALESSLEIFAALRTPPWSERARRELERIPGRRTGAHGELTAAESRIAELVAAGRSNRDVAAALFVSVKTVEVTLTRIYQKVGVRSRSELAHRFAGAAKQ